MALRVAFLSSLVGLSLVGCSCGGPDTSKSPPPVGVIEPAVGEVDAHVPRDTLIVGVVANLGTLIAPVMQTLSDSQVVDITSYPIMNSEFDCSLKRLPGLAKEFSWSDDGTVLSMTLRDDIKWSDGVPVTTDDIAFTYDLMADKTVASPRSDMVGKMTPDARPKIIDKTHIEWHFTEAYDRDTQGAHANAPLVPKHALEKENRETLRGAAYGRDPKLYLASGPWKLAEFKPNETIVLEPNAAFTGPAEMRPHLNRVIMKVIPDYNTRLLELEKGDIDMMESLRVQDADSLRANHPEIKLYKAGARRMDYIGWNQKNDLFKDKNVRKALAHAVDGDDMMKKVLGSNTGEIYGQRAIGNITPELCGAFNADVKPLAYDVATAKQLLAGAGWADSDGDGVLDKGGKKFEFDLITGAGNARRADIAVYTQSYLKNVGVKVNIVQVESNLLFERLRTHDFEAAIAGWSAALFLDPSNVWGSDTPEKPREFNFTSYSNPDVDALIAKGLSTPKPEDAAPIWKEMQAKVYDDQPYLFLWWMDEITALNSRFENVHINVGSSYDKLYDWRVPKDKVKYP